MVDCAVGMSVHYTDSEGECAAATIVRVWNKEIGSVSLQVFRVGEHGMIPKFEVSFSRTSKRGTWHWPERA